MVTFTASAETAVKTNPRTTAANTSFRILVSPRASKRIDTLPALCGFDPRTECGRYTSTGHFALDRHPLSSTNTRPLQCSEMVNKTVCMNLDTTSSHPIDMKTPLHATCKFRAIPPLISSLIVTSCAATGYARSTHPVKCCLDHTALLYLDVVPRQMPALRSLSCYL